MSETGIIANNPKRFFLIPSRSFHPIDIMRVNKKYRERTKDDYIIRFNRICKTNNAIFGGKTDWRLIRAGVDVASYKDGSLRGLSPKGTPFIIVIDDEDDPKNCKRLNKIVKKKDNQISKYTTVQRSEVDQAYDQWKIKNGKPSLGFYVIMDLMKKYPKAELVLIGFTFKGYQAHNFQEERRILMDLIQKKKLIWERTV